MGEIWETPWDDLADLGATVGRWDRIEDRLRPLAPALWLGWAVVAVMFGAWMWSFA